MLSVMTRLTIAVPDDLAGKIREAGGTNVSAWLAKAARDALLREEVTAVSAYEHANQDQAWDDERESDLFG